MSPHFRTPFRAKRTLRAILKHGKHDHKRGRGQARLTTPLQLQTKLSHHGASTKKSTSLLQSSQSSSAKAQQYKISPAAVPASFPLPVTRLLVPARVHSRLVAIILTRLRLDMDALAKCIHLQVHVRYDRGAAARGIDVQQNEPLELAKGSDLVRKKSSCKSDFEAALLGTRM